MKRLALLLAACAARQAPEPPPAPPPPVQVPQDVGPSWIGVRPDPTSTRLTQVIHDTPAERGGLLIGDELLAIDGVPIATAEELVAHLHALPAGKKATIAVRRAGKQLTVSVTPEPMPDADALLEHTVLGKTAPDVIADKLDGTTWKLADQRNRVVVLEFWATWCGPCAETAHVLDTWHAQHPSIEIIGITAEDEPTVRTYVGDHPHSYTLARDRDAAAWHAYLVQAIPTIIVVDKAGVVRYAGIGAGDFDKLDALVERLSR